MNTPYIFFDVACNVKGISVWVAGESVEGGTTSQRAIPKTHQII